MTAESSNADDLAAPEIVLCIGNIVVNLALLDDAKWLNGALEAKDDDGNPELRLGLYPTLMGQEAVDYIRTIARSESRDSVLKAIDDEPELPGEMPGEMLATLIQAVQSHDHDLLTETLRIVVRQTKEGIRERYLASVTRR